MKTILLAAAAVLVAGASVRAAEPQGSRLSAGLFTNNPALAARPAATAANAPVARAAETGTFRMAPLDTYAEVLRRPLFETDRRAHEAPQAAAVDRPFALRGIVILPAASYALIEEDKATKRVTEGQALGGGTVTQILRDRVVLNVNGVETAVKLFDPNANGKPTPGLSTAGGIPSQLPSGYQPSALPSRPPLSGG
jgi:type II secretory pathway component PulC